MVSASNRSELRSPFEAGIRARVSGCAHHSPALCQSQAPIPPSFNLPFLVHSSARQAQVSSVHPHSLRSLQPVPAMVFMQCAVLSGTLRGWGLTLLYRLVCLARPSDEGIPCFPLSFFPIFSLFIASFFLTVSIFPSCHSPLATAKYLPPFVPCHKSFPYCHDKR